MAARADTDVPTNEPIHSSDKIKHLRLRFSEADEAIDYSWDRASKNSVHGYLLRNNIKLNTDLILSEWHVDENVSNKNKHDPQHCKWQRLSIVMEILGNVHVI